MTEGPQVAFVGAGPGRPDLLTIRGQYLLQAADVVLTDDLVHPEIYLRHLRDTSEVFRCGKRAGQFQTPQNEICSLLVEQAEMGRRVVRLKGGDPMVFGRLQEELDAVHTAGLRYEIVPGITAASGCSAYAGPLLTVRGAGRAVTFMTGTTADNDTDWEAAARLGVLVLYMGVLGVAESQMRLLEAGLDSATPVRIVRWGTRGVQQVQQSMLGRMSEDIRHSEIRPPALILIGQGHDAKVNPRWFAQLPLAGRGLVMFRPDERGWLLADKLRALGLEVLNFPLRRPRQSSFDRSRPSDALHVVTSGIAAGLCPLQPGDTAICVGEQAATILRRRGVHIAHTAGRAAALLQFLSESRPQQLVHWAGRNYRPELGEIARKLDISYQARVMYTMEPDSMVQAVALDWCDRIPDGSVFLVTSPETWEHAREMYALKGARWRVWAIGDTTAEVLRAENVPVDLVVAHMPGANHDEQLLHALQSDTMPPA